MKSQIKHLSSEILLYYRSMLASVSTQFVGTDLICIIICDVRVFFFCSIHVRFPAVHFKLKITMIKVTLHLTVSP